MSKSQMTEEQRQSWLASLRRAILLLSEVPGHSRDGSIRYPHCEDLLNARVHTHAVIAQLEKTDLTAGDRFLNNITYGEEGTHDDQ